MSVKENQYFLRREKKLENRNQGLPGGYSTHVDRVDNQSTKRRVTLNYTTQY